MVLRQSSLVTLQPHNDDRRLHHLSSELNLIPPPRSPPFAIYVPTAARHTSSSESHGCQLLLNHVTLVMSTLPELTKQPSRYPGSCIFLSTDVVGLFCSAIPPKPSMTLSVGSGTGLLEAIVGKAKPTCTIECVEVESLRTEGKYVAQNRFHYVQGTWATCQRAQYASMWLFVFPRDPKLLKKYVDLNGDGQVRSILWLGPREDWPMFKDAVRHEKFNAQCEFGQGVLQPNEMGWLWSHSHSSIEAVGECQLPSCTSTAGEQHASGPTENELSNI